MKRRAWTFTTALLLATGLSAPRSAPAESVLVEIGSLEPGDLVVRGFELDRAQEVRIEALGFESRQRGHKTLQLAAAWILDGESREVVWNSDDARPVERRRDFVELQERLRLGAGVYEAYYATYPGFRSGAREGWWESAARTVARMFGWNGSADFEDAVGDLRLVVRGAGRALDAEDLEGSRARLREGALVALSARDDRFAESRGFLLERPMELLVYAVGELADDGGYDYGWILDADSRKKVWTFAWDGSEPAGGATKNRVAHAAVSLPAGRYAAFFVTDGSHSPGGWNALPPRDPAFWGLTLWLKDPGQARYAKRWEYRHLPDDDRVIVELTRLRDGDHRSQGFTLSEPMDVRVYAVGEGRERGMADYGWIVDARTRRKVWTMDYARTDHAGGSAKNRVADEVVRLEAGSYLVAFVTDGSHAYRDWNADPPTYPERWGITLFGGEGFDRSKVAEYREEEDPAVLARIARVRSQRHERLRFTLDRDREVAVYALGEGTHGEMYDYAWLEDARGRRIWEMTYSTTDRAGGASKNRLYQGTLELKAGEYVLHYRTDDSHAYREWNAPPPHDAEAWGVRVAALD